MSMRIANEHDHTMLHEQPVLRKSIQIIEAIYRAIHIAWLNYLGLFAWSTPPKYLASKILVPIEQILFFTLVGSEIGGQGIDFYVVGNAVHVVALSGIFGISMAINGERWSGTLGYLFAAPSSKIFLLGARTLLYLLDGMLGVGLGFVFGAVFFHLDFSNAQTGALILAILLITLSTSALGLLIGSISLVSLNVLLFSNCVYLIMLLLCGVNVPVANLPSHIQFLSYALPLTRGLAATRLALQGGTWQTIAPLLAGEAIVGLAYFALGYFTFVLLERKARQGSILDAY